MNKRQEIYPADYGNRDSATLNYVIDRIKAADQPTIILSGGAWTITNDVVIPSNAVFEVVNGSTLVVDTGANMEFTNVVFRAGRYPVFSGAGTASGDADFIYRWPEWGDTTRFDIGDGVYSDNFTGTQSFENVIIDNANIVSLTCTLGRFNDLYVAHNIYVGNDGIVTNDFYVGNDLFVGTDSRFTNDVWIGGNLDVEGDTTLSNLTVNGTADFNGPADFNDTTTFNSNLVFGNEAASNSVFNAVADNTNFTTTIRALAATSPSYITGCYGNYVDGDTTKINVGAGLCNGNYFQLLIETNVDITPAGAAYNVFHYYYIDDSGSTYPNDLAIYSSTNEPTFSTNLVGWYNGAIPEDRVLWAVLEQASTGVIFEYLQDRGKFTFGLTVATVINQNLTGPSTWDVANTAQVEDWTPVNAVDAWLDAHCEDGASTCWTKIKTTEHVAVLSTWAYERGEIICKGYDDQRIGPLPLRLGPSRSVRYTGQADDEGADSALHGFTIER
jgi:hypothetical protein